MTKRDKLIEMLQNKDCIKDINNALTMSISVLCEACRKVNGDCSQNCSNSTDDFLNAEYFKNKITLSVSEIELLNALKILDFKYIARDFDDSLYAFKEKPEKHGKCWDDNSVYYHFQKIDEYLFKFIQWSDDEPYSVYEL